jgi:hypothetical protein
MFFCSPSNSGMDPPTRRPRPRAILALQLQLQLLARSGVARTRRRAQLVAHRPEEREQLGALAQPRRLVVQFLQPIGRHRAPLEQHAAAFGVAAAKGEANRREGGRSVQHETLALRQMELLVGRPVAQPAARAPLEQQPHSLRVAALRRTVERRKLDVAHHKVDVAIHVGVEVEQQLHVVDVAGPRRLGQRRAAVRDDAPPPLVNAEGRVRVGATFESAPRDVHVLAPDRLAQDWVHLGALAGGEGLEHADGDDGLDQGGGELALGGGIRRWRREAGRRVAQLGALST